MTNHWIDLKNAKVILIEGSNAAENHSMSMKWIMRAKENGAKVIHVDPRYTRTSKIADIFAQIRPGTDIAFLGAIINYILENKLYDETFVKTHTNSMYYTNEEFSFENGVFSGYDEAERKYSTESWSYQLDDEGKPIIGTSLDDPQCAFSKLKKFYSRYTFQVSSDITGIPVDTIKLIADTYVNGGPGTIMYALGMTQHTVGVQNIRSFGILQLLLGNVGKPGTGINALRGEPNVQGSTDFALLFNYAPGYFNWPNSNQPTLEDWTMKNGTFRRRFFVNLLKAWFGENGTPENDFGYKWLPKKNADTNYSIYRIFETALDNSMKFMYIVGQNPMVTSPNLNLVHEGFCKLDMLVVNDLFMTETASFWEKPGVDPSTIDTEVIFLPAASFLEKEGTLTNSGRLVQWRYTGIKPVGEAKSDLEIFDMIFTKMRDLYSNSSDPKDEIFKKITWGYPKDNASMADAVLKEINGYDLETGKLATGIGALRDDGTTCSGNWLYAGVYTEEGNHSMRTGNSDPSGLGVFPEFKWCWPGNAKILYNRASADINGKPWDENNKYVWWDANEGKWTGHDVPDVGNVNDGPDKPGGRKPFRMTGEGVGRLIANAYGDMDATHEFLPRDISNTPADGPIPEFYEPVESPTTNVLHPDVPINPCLKYPRIEAKQPIGKKEDFPYVLCTSSIAEHWCAGSVTRNIPWLNELVKETYVEMPVKLADKLGVKNGDRVAVSSARGEIDVKAMVTHRIQPLKINGEEVNVVWMPYNWGYKGLSTAASTNLLTIDAGDPNTWIQETKACLVNIKKA